MSDHQETYYEIALTNRQAMLLFIALLVIPVVSFLLGMKVGRNPQIPAINTNQAAAWDPEEMGTPAEASAQSAPQSSREVAVETETVESDPSTLAAEVKREEWTPEAPPADPIPETTSVQPSTEPKTETEPMETIVEEKPVPESKTPAARALVPKRTRAPAPENPDGYFVQVFSSQNEEQAREILANLEAAGYTAFLREAPVGTETTYRVRVGPFSSRVAADQSATDLRKEFKVSTWVTSQP